MARTARPNQLTELQVRAYATGEPTGKELHDGAGLYLRRRDAGAYWYLRAVSPVTGKAQWLKLFDGDALDGWPHKSLKDARDEAERKRDLLREGLDPRIEKRKAIEREQAAEKARVIDLAQARSVEDLFAEFKRLELRPVIKNGVRERGRKDGGAGVEAHFRLHVFPTIGRMPARDVRKADLLVVLDQMRERGIHRSANVVLQGLKQFFDWAGPDRRGYLQHNPAAGLERRDAGGRDAIRKRHLCATHNPPKREEFSDLAAKLPKSGLSDSMQAAAWLLLATVVRAGELAGARWEYVDLRARTWYLPNTKNQVPHLIHLSTFAVEQFRVLQRVHAERIAKGAIPKTCPYVMPNRDGKGPIAPEALTKQFTDRQVEGEPLKNRTTDSQALMLPYGRWVAHDLRRSGATLMRQLRVSSEVVHLCLNHRDQKLLAETYEQDGDEAAQRRAFDLLGRKLAEYATPTPAANITPIGSARRQKTARLAGR
jgi:integrase